MKRIILLAGVMAIFAACSDSNDKAADGLTNSERTLVAKLDHISFGNGINVNIKFDAQTVADATGRASLEALVRGYFAQGGMQVQINVLDPSVLEDAMCDPDSHRNLLVRISGYCAYFVDLTPSMQQELIDRTRQQAQ